ncbi:phage late control D family protein [Streptomyces sp. NRRL S-646]|uniref:phage late control D family protein n=1 Tax=Streptomyces sp. NRRL S-646 TaxID=1463917 RepID=UPI0004C8EB18|nr:contractile injection system protein, VgrG/Pvc8 family [Streptomyces sp. NRRL S-646]
MVHDQLRIEVDGDEPTGLTADLLGLEVELDDQLAGMFRLTLALRMQPDGSWPYLDDDRFALWRRVDIIGGPQDGTRQLIIGYVTHLRPDFGPDLDRCRLEVWGLDATVLMDRADRLRAWPNKTDSDIATEVLRSYGLTPEVTGTDVVHDERVSTVVQRESDIRLLRRLAFRNGFSCYVDGDTAYFGPPRLEGGQLPPMAVQFGPRTNVERFTLEVNAFTPTDVTMTQTDRLTGDVLRAEGRAELQRALGSRPPDDLGTLQVGQTVSTGEQEMSALCQSLYDEGQWFVTGEGEVLGNAYPAVLVPHALVPIKGIGATHSGVYEVTHVTHVFTPAGYRQRFRVRRNATQPTGEEDFG